MFSQARPRTQIGSEEPGTGAGSLFRSNARLSDYYGRYAFVETEAVQFGRGALEQKSLTIWGQNSILTRNVVVQRASSTLLAPSDWIMFQYPMSWHGDLKVDGYLARPQDTFFMDGGQEWFTVGEHRDVLLLAIKRRVLSEACASQKGLDFVSLHLGNHALGNSPAFSALLRSIYSRMLSAAGTLGLIKGRLVMPKAHEADMISALAANLNTPPQEASVLGDRRNATRIVKTAREALRAAGQDHLTISDLCKSVGVGRTWLHQCFVEVYGVSASQYLKNHRMTRAREWLLDPIAPPTAVKDAALTLGFCTSGRFAREYKGMFGELPSKTLHRTRER
jgi:AraC-like DNA-binding protein